MSPTTTSLFHWLFSPLIQLHRRRGDVLHEILLLSFSSPSSPAQPKVLGLKKRGSSPGGAVGFSTGQRGFSVVGFLGFGRQIVDGRLRLGGETISNHLISNVESGFMLPAMRDMLGKVS